MTRASQVSAVVPSTGATEVALYRSIFAYDPHSGELTWRPGTGRARAGQTAGYIGHHGYRVVRVNRLMTMAHRIAFAISFGPYTGYVDHIDGNRLNNAFANLRLATRSENNRNQKLSTRNSIGLKGVSFHRASQKYRAQIKVDSRKIHLGLYPSAEAAHAAYCTAASQLHGEFARLA